MDLAQKDYIRKQCLGFDVERLARVYDNYIDKTFEELVELAQAERRDMEQRDLGLQVERRGNDREGSHPTHRRAPATPSSAASVFGRTEHQVGRKQTATASTIKTESPIDLTQDEEDLEQGEIDHEPPFAPEGPEPSEYDGEDSSDMSSLNSDTSNDVVANQFARAPLHTTRRARLRRVAAWLLEFDWTEETQKTDVIDYCWDLEMSASVSGRLFTSRSVLQMFLRRWAHTLGKKSPELAGLYAGNVLARRLPVSPLMNRQVPQRARKTRHHSYGREGSFVASDDEDGKDAKHARTAPSTKKIKVNRTVNANSQEQIKRRVDRVLVYAESYRGWSTGVIRHFNNWVLEQELKSLNSGHLEYSDTLKTIGAVEGLIYRVANLQGWDHCPQLNALLRRG